jgi:hypothetical protein
MLKFELKDKLREEGINVLSYSLNGGLPNEAYCLNQSAGKWEVYYSERGSKAGLRIFDLERDACVYLYNLLHTDLAIPLEKRESYIYTLLKNLLNADVAKKDFFNKLNGLEKYRFIITEKRETHTLYFSRRNNGNRSEDQLKQFDEVLKNLALYDGDKVAIHLVSLVDESFMFFTSADIKEYFGCIIVPRRIAN